MTDLRESAVSCHFVSSPLGLPPYPWKANIIRIDDRFDVGVDCENDGKDEHKSFGM